MAGRIMLMKDVHGHPVRRRSRRTSNPGAPMVMRLVRDAQPIDSRQHDRLSSTEQHDSARGERVHNLDTRRNECEAERRSERRSHIGLKWRNAKVRRKRDRCGEKQVVKSHSFSGQQVSIERRVGAAAAGGAAGANFGSRILAI